MAEDTQTEDIQREEQFHTGGEKESILAETTSDGRYIPYSGGIMSWYENSGLLKCELPNNYRFHEMVDANSVRKKLFERWGSGENISRRATERHKMLRPIHLLLVSASGKSITCTGKDYSSHGFRLQIEGADQTGFSKGDIIRVIVRENAEAERALFDIPSQIMWAHQVGKTSETLSLGIAFMELSADKRQQLLQFFRR